MDDSKIPKAITVSAFERQCGFGALVDEAVASGALQSFRKGSRGWRYVWVSDGIAWLETLKPKSSETRAA